MTGTALQNEPTLVLTNINLSFGSLKVLNNINLKLNAGEIHAVLGEHGAGKSSLAKLISGYISPQSGNIRLFKKNYDSISLQEARTQKVHMIYQHSALNPYFTIAENLFYTDKKLPFFSWRHKTLMFEKAQEYLDGYGFDLDPRQLTRSLNRSDRTVLEILVNIRETPSVLILDESLENISTSALPKIMDIIFDLKRRGCTILIITHKVDGLNELADRITIIRDGQNIFSETIGQVDKIQLIKMAYTQIATLDESQNHFSAFYELIKYNEAILVNLPVNLVIIDTLKTVRMINQFCIRSFNLNQEEYIGRQIANFFQGTNEAQVDTIIRSINTFQEEQFFHFEMEINGKKGIFNIRIFPVKDEGFLLGSIVLLEDITEYSNLQKQDIISDKLASLGLVAASVAHEINNPLEIIYNYLTNLRFKFGSKEIHTITEKIQKELDYITHIVSDLQELGTERQAWEEININYHIQEVISLVNYNARIKNVKVVFEKKSSDIEITINKNEMKQVLLNLFKNSLEAMPDGGLITIETAILFAGERKNFCIYFKDTGVGIPNNKDLFVPFYSTKQSNEISGLGLSICHSIISKYKGNITLTNNPEGGCLVTILLPVNQSEKLGS